MPKLQPPEEAITGYANDFREFTADLYEWLSLVLLESPRITTGDKIDSYLSRYQHPASENDKQEQQDLVLVRWTGFMSADLAHKIFISASQKASSKMWLSFSVHGFSGSLVDDCRDCTILKLPGPANEYLLWEVDQK